MIIVHDQSLPRKQTPSAGVMKMGMWNITGGVTSYKLGQAFCNS